MKHKKISKAWLILLGLPAIAASQQSGGGAGPGPASRETANQQQGATAREQLGKPTAMGTAPQAKDAVKVITRVPIPPEELGLAWGGFQWYPDVQLGLHLDNNLFATRDNQIEDWMWSFTPSVVGRSESDNRELNVRLGVNAQRYWDNHLENADDMWADLQGTLHLSDATSIFGGAGWSKNHEDRGSPDVQLGRTPTVYTDTSVHGGVFHDFGRHYMRVGIAGTRLDFDPVATSTPGVIIDSNARDRDVTSIGGRWGWRATKSADLFLQGTLEQRDYKRTTDLAGYERSSNGHRLDVGVAFDVDRHLVGEAYAGVMQQRYNDPRFKNVNELDVGADVRWHPSPWTTYRMGLERTLDETVVTGSPGYMSTTASARVEHDLNAHTVFSGGVARTQNRFRQIERDDYQTSLNAGLRHYIDSSVYIGADYRYIHRKSGVLEANYDRSLFMLTLGTDFGARRRNRYFAYQERDDVLWPAASQSFSGFYVGLQGGATTLQTNSSGLRDLQPGNTDAGQLAHLGSNVGLFAGTGWQWGPWYTGVEISAQASGHKVSHEHPNAQEPLVYNVKEQSGWAAGLRLGRVVGGTSLLYGRIGLAKTTFDNAMLNLDGSFATEQSLDGRQLGLGTEVQLSSSAFLRMDYTVTRYDDYHLVTPSYDELYRHRTSAFMIGLGWRLGGGTGAQPVNIDPSYLNGVYGGVQVGHGTQATNMLASEHYHAGGSDTLRADFGRMGSTAGGFVGWGHTLGRWYLGVEMDAEDSARMKWSHDRVTSGGGGRDFSVAKKWSYSGSLRAGYMLPNGALLYGRAGAARALFNTRYSRGNSGALDRDDTLDGQLWGIGLEVPISRASYWRLDYIATSYDDVPAFQTLGSNPDTISWSGRENLFRLGFGVRF